MIKSLEKIKSSVPLFKKTCTCTILPPPFFIFLDFPLPREVSKIYFPPLKRGGS